MRVTSERNNAHIAIAIVRIPPVDIGTISIGITDVHQIAIRGNRVVVLPNSIKGMSLHRRKHSLIDKVALAV